MDSHTIVYILYSMLAVFLLWAVWYGCKPYKKTEDYQYKEAKSSPLIKYDRRFVPNEEFCLYCFTNSYFWTGGGATAVDRCPRHNEDDGGVILWKNMNIWQRNRAAKKFQDMWKEKHGVVYRFTRYKD
jgi:hypothetical protein